MQKLIKIYKYIRKKFKNNKTNNNNRNNKIVLLNIYS